MSIKPIGEQIIIRVISPDSVGSIILPDSAKGITQIGEKGDAVHFVEAEVIAIGTGKRMKGDAKLVDEMAEMLALGRSISIRMGDEPTLSQVNTLLDRAKNNHTTRLPFLTKPGDRILYHPSVQKFDREVDVPGVEGRCFIIREDSVLAVIER